jgi:hypothetical protein
MTSGVPLVDTKKCKSVESEASQDTGPRSYRFGPFALRKRATMAEFDWKTTVNAARLNTSVEHVKTILRKRIRASELTPRAHHAIALMFNAAADQQHAKARRSALLQHTRQSKEAVADLPTRSLGVLNKRLVEAQDRSEWRSFDSEVFAALTEDLISTTPSLRPRCKAMRVYEILREPLPSPFANAPRTPKSDLIDLWESIPSSTRSAVEAAIRNARPQRSLVKFLQELVQRLQAHWPQKKRMPAHTRQYAQRICKIWDDLGIHVGATDQYEVDGPFQRCCQAALRAFDDHWSITRGQVVYLQKSAAHMHRKRLKSRNIS